MSVVELKRTVPPDLNLPIDESVAKLHLRVDHNDDDVYIRDIIDAAIEAVEGELSGAIMTQTWQETIERFRSGHRLRLGPVQQVQKVEEFDNDSYIWDTLDLSGFYVESDIVYIRPQTSISLDTRHRITYVAGYGDGALDVPFSIRQAILLVMSDLYESRGTSASPATSHFTNMTMYPIPTGVKYLLSRYRRYF